MSEYHQLGVAVPNFEYNHSFQFGKRLSTTLRVPSHTYNSSKRFYLYYTNPYLPQIVRKGDRVLFGPSTYPNYEGAMESGVVSNVSSYFIELTQSLTNVFNTDDEVNTKGNGSMLAAGWTLGCRNGSAFSPTNLWYPFLPSSGHTDRTGLFHLHDSTYGDTEWNAYFGGFTNRYRQFIRWGSGDYASGQPPFSNQPTLNRDYGNVLKGNTVYRLGLYVKGAGASGVYIKCADTSTTNFINFNFSTSVGSSFTEISSTGTSASIPTSCQVMIYNTNTNTLSIMIDDIYMEHAKYTDGNSAGVYTFTELPERDSETFERLAETEYILERAPSGRGIPSQSSGTDDRVEKFRISMNFTNVSSSFYANLRKLFEWQKSGYKLIFHPNDYIAAQTKPIIYCNIALTNISPKMWDRTKLNFTLTVEEV